VVIGKKMIKNIIKHWLLQTIVALTLLVCAIVFTRDTYMTSGVFGIIVFYGIPIGMLIGIYMVNASEVDPKK